MRKTFMGVQLRRLREERGLTQVALARTLGLSASYLNQIEQNQRPLTVPVLLKISAALGVDVQRFSDDEEARLIAGLNEVLADQPQVSLHAGDALAAQEWPATARACSQPVSTTISRSRSIRSISSSTWKPSCRPGSVPPAESEPDLPRGKPVLQCASGRRATVAGNSGASALAASSL